MKCVHCNHNYDDVCPACGLEITEHDIARIMGRRGGQKSRRKQTTEQARELANRRWHPQGHRKDMEP